MFLKENFKEVEISCKDKFLTTISEVDSPIIYSEKDKEYFTPFLIKNFSLTAYNCLAVSVREAELGNIGFVIFLNKNIEKERIDYNPRDESLAAL